MRNLTILLLLSLSFVFGQFNQNNISAGGYHSLALSSNDSISWNADAEASGIYFVKMHAGAFFKTQKIMLIK